jgi:hypothetical protein
VKWRKQLRLQQVKERLREVGSRGTNTETIEEIDQGVGTVFVALNLRARSKARAALQLEKHPSPLVGAWIRKTGRRARFKRTDTKANY